MKNYFICIRFLGPAFNRIQIELIDDKGNRPGRFRGQVYRFSRRYSPQSVWIGVRFFTRLREKMERRIN